MNITASPHPDARPARGRGRRRVAQAAIGLALTCLFLWLGFRQIQVEQVSAAISQARASWVIGALVAFLLGYSCRVARWRVMLCAHNPKLTWRDCAGPLFASVAANNLLPFRMGDLVRSFGFCKQLGVSQGVAVTTLFVERLLDLLMVLLFLAAALAVFGGGGLIRLSSLIPVVTIAGLAGLLLFPAVFERIALHLTAALRRFLPGLSEGLSREIHRGAETIGHVSIPATMFRLLGWSALAWLCEGLVFWFCALALPTVQNPAGAWLALPVGTLATVIPSSPGFVGTFDYFTAQALMRSGDSFATGAAFAVLVHLLLWLPPTLLGGLHLLSHPVKGLLKTEKA
ncbi:hypothetical protein CCR94_06215 [Rhodoblastus sphagnicola]|uniref:Lysylphosphatidylglycerol synthetase n=1 Tax=Rhodoblastus sphagnicola TaxID=333368 RepID=A0A2S6NCH9_9HYPH|nr:lysylphosphatidylglycerol synthase transmembrane domain-containing protein [Rhodoblastus sphagnicola]PPQ32291.1 hypothetical protein CCR94_06215 [Rhodoblastus sphagnicola]